MNYGKLHVYATGTFLREASREDWIHWRKHGGDPHTGAHLGLNGHTVWIEDPPSEDPEGPLSPKEAMRQFLAFLQKDPKVRASSLKDLFVRVTSADLRRSGEVLVDFVTRGRKDRASCGAIEVCGSSDFKTTHYLTCSPHWKERALERIKLVGGF